MLVNRRFPPALLIIYTFRVMIVAAVWAAIVFALYAYADFHFLRQPFLPISTSGTAVAFYVGFKNKSVRPSPDRPPARRTAAIPRKTGVLARVLRDPA